MLLERNENRQLPSPTTQKHDNGKQSKQKKQKENQLNPNRKKKPIQLKSTSEKLPLDPKQRFIVTETNKVKNNNLKKILSHELSKSKENYRDDILSRHNISADIRARMVD